MALLGRQLWMFLIIHFARDLPHSISKICKRIYVSSDGFENVSNYFAIFDIPHIYLGRIVYALMESGTDGLFLILRYVFLALYLG